MCRVLSIGVMLTTLLAAVAANATSYSFMVFFDYGSAVLGDKAITTVQQFAELCRPAGKYRIGLT